MKTSVHGAHNTGLDHTNGKYIALLDADDAFHPEMIAQLLDALIRNQADLAVCNFAEYRTEGNLRKAMQMQTSAPG